VSAAASSPDQFPDRLQSDRTDYRHAELRRVDLDPDPLAQFERWFGEAVSAGLREPNAMTVATVDASGMPDARILLLRGTENAGFQFFTNYESKKGQDLAASSGVALVLFWRELERQVRVRGRVSKLDRERSAAYFGTRPRGSQLGAWLSQQSAVAPVDVDLSREISALETRFAGEPVPLPPKWGGYHVTPFQIEFWQGRPSRLHDRLLYTRQADRWNIVRLAP
jgi:pyridoxamine 5'-phosphate oxidase